LENHPQRKSPRLAGYDYALPNAYLVTIGIDQAESRFGTVEKGVMRLNDAGTMIDEKWRNISRRFASMELDPYIVMPNHFHGIVFIGTDPDQDPLPLSRIVQAFKSESAMEYTRGVHAGLFPRYRRSLWQRSLHDKILPNQKALEAARAYVMNNPRAWQEELVRLGR
jgi:REP element-mobilizing transposase RayT